jgi:hypothetical protein
MIELRTAANNFAALEQKRLQPALSEITRGH